MLPHAGSPTFKEVVERAKGVVLDAVANADIPFHQVVDAAAVARSAAYTPVFQTQLTLEGWAGEPGAAGGGAQGRMGDLAAEPLPVPPLLLFANLAAKPLPMRNDPGAGKAPYSSVACWDACHSAWLPPKHNSDQLPVHASSDAGMLAGIICLWSRSSQNETLMVYVGRLAAAQHRWTSRWTCMRRSTPYPAAWSTPRTCSTAAPWSASPGTLRRAIPSRIQRLCWVMHVAGAPVLHAPGLCPRNGKGLNLLYGCSALALHLNPETLCR